MITVLHGTDLDSSYKRLSQLLSFNKNYRLAQFDHTSKHEDIHQEVFAKSLFEENKVIVLKNILTKDKKLPEILSNAPKDLQIICWEQDQLTQTILTKLTKFAKVENFKLPPTLFYFLDNIAPGRKKIVSDLLKLDGEASMLWNIQYRFLLLTLAKFKIDIALASKITKRSLQGWQWDKIKLQAEKFQLQTLLAICSASLKIGYLTKSGQTNLSPNLLARLMLLKYL